jgi:glycerol uptake facilitator-like aquaporin
MAHEGPAKALLCEFGGTFVLVAVGIAATIYGRILFGDDSFAEHGFIALACSFVVSLAILGFGVPPGRS